MKVEWGILFFVWFFTFAFVFPIPSAKKRIAIVAVLFKQLITWATGLLVVEFHLISYPINFLSDVNQASFTYEYFVYPVFCGVFNAFYPNSRSKFYQFLYYCLYCTSLTIPEALFEKHTELILYLNWGWYWTWITLFLTFMMTRWFCVWFFNGLAKEID
jgi:hypothetical protein